MSGLMLFPRSWHGSGPLTDAQEREAEREQDAGHVPPGVAEADGFCPHGWLPTDCGVCRGRA